MANTKLARLEEVDLGMMHPDLEANIRHRDDRAGKLVEAVGGRWWPWLQRRIHGSRQQSDPGGSDTDGMVFST